MKVKTWNLNKIEYGIVGNLPTMNHFLIMVLHKKANIFMLHHLMGCRLSIMFHPSAFECLCIPSLNHLNHKCKFFIALQLGMHVERGGPHTPCNYAKKLKNVTKG